MQSILKFGGNLILGAFFCISKSDSSAGSYMIVLNLEIPLKSQL